MPILDRIGSFVSSLPDAPIAIRIGIFFLVWLLLWLPIAIPISIAVKWQPFHPLENRQKLPLVISLYLLAPLVLWGFAQWQDFPFSAYGLSLEQSVLVGMGVGVLGLGVLFGIQTVLGWLRWRVENLQKWGAALAPTLLLALWIGVTEELIFRGLLFGQLEQEFGFWAGAIASSVIFSVSHLTWEGRAQVPQLPGLAMMGLVLCLAVSAQNGGLGLAWGLHTGWVWMIASLSAAELIEYPGTVPDWLTGLDGKPLAGFLGLGLLLATAGVVLAVF
jgi:uncharacterized protein